MATSDAHDRRTVFLYTLALVMFALVALVGLFGLISNARTNGEVKVARYEACSLIEDSQAALICIRGLK